MAMAAMRVVVKTSALCLSPILSISPFSLLSCDIVKGDRYASGCVFFFFFVKMNCHYTNLAAYEEKSYRHERRNVMNNIMKREFNILFEWKNFNGERQLLNLPF